MKVELTSNDHTSLDDRKRYIVEENSLQPPVNIASLLSIRFFLPGLHANLFFQPQQWIIIIGRHSIQTENFKTTHSIYVHTTKIDFRWTFLKRMHTQLLLPVCLALKQRRRQKKIRGRLDVGRFALNLVLFSYSLGYCNSNKFIGGSEPVTSPHTRPWVSSTSGWQTPWSSSGLTWEKWNT